MDLIECNLVHPDLLVDLLHLTLAFLYNSFICLKLFHINCVELVLSLLFIFSIKTDDLLLCVIHSQMMVFVLSDSEGINIDDFFLMNLVFLRRDFVPLGLVAEFLCIAKHLAILFLVHLQFQVFLNLAVSLTLLLFL